MLSTFLARFIYLVIGKVNAMIEDDDLEPVEEPEAPFGFSLPLEMK